MKCPFGDANIGVVAPYAKLAAVVMLPACDNANVCAASSAASTVAQETLSFIPEDRSKDAWIAATWRQEWEASGPTRVHRHVSDPGEGVKGEDLSRNTGRL